jgi:AmmeMemoRadiSam system protein B
MIKKTVVAGSFYPNDKNDLLNMLDTLVKVPVKVNEKKLFAIVSPHAGYDYSGQTAGAIYGVAKQYQYKNAIIIAPSHYNNSCDFFIGNYDFYQTPLGNLRTNKENIQKLIAKPGFSFMTSIDAKEHSLETQLPFLYYLNPEIKITPIIFVRQNLMNAKRLADYLLEFMDDETLLVISTDLSHFHDCKKAELIDNQLISYVKANDTDSLYVNIANKVIEACGYAGIMTLMFINRNISNVTIDNLTYSQSGKVTGDNDRVVGYFSCGYYKS